jgi:hypothetical protein
MLRKEREQKAFFEEMERNILKNLGARTAPNNPVKEVLESPGSILTEEADAPYDEVLLTPTEDSTLQIQDSWVQAWIDNASPLTLDSSSSSSSSSPMSTHSSSSVTSCESGNDTLMPLTSSHVNKSKLVDRRSIIEKAELKRNKSYEKAINKPNLVRTISKMEYDLTLLLKGMETSPTGVDLLSPGDRSHSDLLASLCITQDAEGVGCDLLHAFEPLSPGSTSVSSMETDVTGPSCDLAKPNMTKRNTCGTIYLGSTLSTPDKDALIQCVGGGYRAHLLHAEADDVQPRDVDRIFDDDQSPYRRVSAHRPFMPS